MKIQSTLPLEIANFSLLIMDPGLRSTYWISLQDDRKDELSVDTRTRYAFQRLPDNKTANSMPVTSHTRVREDYT